MNYVVQFPIIKALYNIHTIIFFNTLGNSQKEKILCVAGLLLNFIKTFFITFAIVSQPFSVKIVIFNSQFTHFSTDVDFEFFTTIFRLLFSG